MELTIKMLVRMDLHTTYEQYSTWLAKCYVYRSFLLSFTFLAFVYILVLLSLFFKPTEDRWTF